MRTFLCVTPTDQVYTCSTNTKSNWQLSEDRSLNANTGANSNIFKKREKKDFPKIHGTQQNATPLPVTR